MVVSVLEMTILLVSPNWYWDILTVSDLEKVAFILHKKCGFLA